MSKFILIITGTFLLSGCTSGAQKVPTSYSSVNKPEPVIFLADPQVHNIYALPLAQMNDISNKASRVAIRPPELNILAPLIMEELIRDATQEPVEAMFVLGDAANIACTSEHKSSCVDLKQIMFAYDTM